MINLPAIFIANGLGVALMVTLLLSNPKGTRNVFLDEKIFIIMCNLTLGLCLMETFTFCIDGKVFWGSVFLNRLVNSMLFITNSVFSFLWTLYVDYKLFGKLERLRKIYPFVAIPAAIVCLLAAFNVYFDILFTVTPDNVYMRTPLAIISYLVTYFYLMMGAVMVFIYRRKVGKYLFMPVIVFLAPIFIGSIIQLFCYGIALIWVTVSFGLISLYIKLQNEVSMLDALTKLYNREYLTRFLNYTMQKPVTSKKTAGIMMDINAFKEINDVYGHSEGDHALQIVGQCLLDVAEHDYFAVRYGGDEFIVICNVGCKEDLDRLTEHIRIRVEQQNKKNALPYQLSLSMGSAFFEPSTDNIDSFLQRMDQRMYENKRIFYSNSKNDRRRKR